MERGRGIVCYKELLGYDKYYHNYIFGFMSNDLISFLRLKL